MRRPLIIIISVVAIFLVLGTVVSSMLGFSPASRSTVTDVYGGYGMGGGGGAPEVSVAPPMEEPASVAANDIAKSGESFSSQGQAAQERLVIENAELSIVVKDPKARMAEIAKLADDMDGYVVSSNIYQSYSPTGKEVPEASIVIRVPSERLDEALAQIKEDAVEVQNENRSGQDVTNIYVDLQSQLRAKEAAEKKLLEILDNAEKAEDVLAIYLQVQSVQTEIEQLKGQIKYYEESAQLSSITLRLVAEEATLPIEVGPWRPEGAAKDAVEDLVRFAQNFTEFLIYFVISIIPRLILIAIPLYLLYLAGRAIYRRYSRSKAVVEVKAEK